MLAEEASAPPQSHPKGKAPSKFTIAILKQAKSKLPFSDTMARELPPIPFSAPPNLVSRVSRRVGRRFSLAQSCSPSIIPFAGYGGIAQLVERLVRNEKARGSNPLTSSPSLSATERESQTRHRLPKKTALSPARSQPNSGGPGRTLRFVAPGHPGLARKERSRSLPCHSLGR
jgi:hypothetical protein